MTTKQDSDYYRRLGGYLGPIKLKVIEVGCPKCGTHGGKPCLGANGPIKKYHSERGEYRDDLNERAAADNSTGRWYRHQFRQGKIPAPPQPCGTFAAYQRHRRKGEEVDEACQEAARLKWRTDKQAVR